MARTLRQIYDADKLRRAGVRGLVPKVASMIRRFTLGRATQAESDTVRVNGTTFGDSATQAEHLQQYGFASLPPSGSEGVHLKQIGAVICVDSRANRPTLAAGEVAVHCEHGQTIHCKADGSVVVLPKSGSNVELAGDPASDFVALAADVLSELTAIQTALNTHVHTGVTTGPGSTGTAVSGYTPSSVAASNVRAT